MDTRKEALFTDFAVCTPKIHLSETRELFKWNVVPYETAGRKGNMLTSMLEGRPQPVSFDPALAGWYKIFVGQGPQNTNVNLQLKDDGTYTTIGWSTAAVPHLTVEEIYWKAADMTGQRVTISKLRGGLPQTAAIAWLRFVPMDDAEVAAAKADTARRDTKRVYATHDMHGMLLISDPADADDWRALMQGYEQSDVEWLSMENVIFFDGDTTTENENNFAYPRACDELVQKSLKKKMKPEVLRDLCAYTRGMGIKPCLSIRMGAWGIEYPFDQMYFANKFFEANKHLRCVDRDGTPIDALSYIYPEVQEYMLGQFETMADLDCDAVEMILSRGIPYVLFEQPFVDLFMARHGGEDPRYLPLDEPRVVALHCEVMTGFVRKLRARVDKKVGVHARVLTSLYDSRLAGIDAAQWAKEGLVTAIISYPQVFREVLEGDVWQEGAEKRLLDLDKYHKHALESPKSIILRRSDDIKVVQIPDSKGMPQGPDGQKERIAQFMELEKLYGVKVYIEIMPRRMSPIEYRDRALEIYAAGGERISLWDTYNRVPIRTEWSMMRRLGHKEELASYGSGEGEFYSRHRVLRIGDKDVSRYLPIWGG